MSKPSATTISCRQWLSLDKWLRSLTLFRFSVAAASYPHSGTVPRIHSNDRISSFFHSETHSVRNTHHVKMISFMHRRVREFTPESNFDSESLSIQESRKYKANESERFILIRRKRGTRTGTKDNNCFFRPRDTDL